MPSQPERSGRTPIVAHVARSPLREPLSPRARGVLFALAVVAAIALRVAGADQELWLDEIWSWGLARAHPSVGEILTNPSSNNHPLNTLWLHWIGDARSFWVYRIHSLAAGIGAVLLAAFAVRRSGGTARLAAFFLFAVSYLMTVYSVEARGYALQVLFALAAFVAVDAWHESRRPFALGLAWASIALGFLSQYLFAHAYAAVAAWSVWRIVRARGDRKGEARRALLLHSVPLAFCAALWFFVLRKLFNAGAPPWHLSEVLEQTIGWTLGLPEHPVAMVLGLAIVIAVVVLDATALAKAGRDEWVFHVTAILVAPIATTLVLSEQYLCPRYFLVSIAFFLLALARVLSRLSARSRTGAMLAIVVLVAFAAGNLARTRQFLVEGKGGYREAVEVMARESKGSTIAVGGNYDFNVSALLDFYRRFLSPGQRIEFHAHDKIARDGPGSIEWFVIDEPRFTAPPQNEIRIAVAKFVLRGTWTYYGPCGSDWAIYRRAE